MKDILNDNFFSIEFFNEQGFEKVAELTGLSYEEIEFESANGNYFIGQLLNGGFYFFCESDEPENEITFNSFIKLLAS